MIKGLLIDLSGTINVGNRIIPGASEAVRRLQREGVPFRFVTNTSRKTRRMLHHDLKSFGVDVPLEHLFTAPLVVRRYLEKERLRPFFLINPNLAPEFADLIREDPDTVVVGFAQHAFTYDALNRAFRLLKQGASLISMGRTRYYQAEDDLDLDAGPFVAALEYAAETKALVLGKPSSKFFLAAVKELGCRSDETVMIGDDAVSDADGALASGLSAILVQTGKYRLGDEKKIEHPGVVLARDVSDAVAQVLECKLNHMTK
jgi:HAD superfamily hydrolase (TIGR01458 family)